MKRFTDDMFFESYLATLPKKRPEIKRVYSLVRVFLSCGGAAVLFTVLVYFLLSWSGKGSESENVPFPHEWKWDYSGEEIDLAGMKVSLDVIEKIPGRKTETVFKTKMGDFLVVHFHQGFCFIKLPNGKWIQGNTNTLPRVSDIADFGSFVLILSGGREIIWYSGGDVAHSLVRACGNVLNPVTGRRGFYEVSRISGDFAGFLMVGNALEFARYGCGVEGNGGIKKIEDAAAGEWLITLDDDDHRPVRILFNPRTKKFRDP